MKPTLAVQTFRLDGACWSVGIGRPFQRAVLALVLGFPCVSFATRMEMTFDGIPQESAPGSAGNWVEDGITATGPIEYYRTPDVLHLDYAATPFPRSADFTTGSVFSPESVMVRGSSAYCASPCEERIYDDPYPYIWITGFLDDVLVGSLELYRPASGL